MNDCLARYGGEEFAILLPQTNLKEAYTVTSRFSAAVRELNLSSIGDDNLSLSISCGVSTAFPGKGREGEHLDALIKRADDALLEAKRSGKDQVVYKDI
jgi:diguanylate cyclase (GGDEF)-like protein